MGMEEGNAMSELTIAQELRPIVNKARQWIAKKVGNETKVISQNVINSLWPNENFRPLIYKSIKTDIGTDLVITVPAGISHNDVIKKLEYFKDATGANQIIFERTGRSLLLRFIEVELKKLYAYDWDYDRTGGELVVPIGYTIKGDLFTYPLEKFPHLLAGSPTGSGKSTFLHILINSLLRADYPPYIFVIDKKKTEFQYLRNHVNLATDDEDICNVFDTLLKEMDRRNEQFSEVLVKEIDGWNKHFDRMRRIVVVIDELAELDNKYYIECITKLLRMSRTAGFNLILSTQRPSSTIFGKAKSFGDLKANLTCRLCWCGVDAINSQIVLDSDIASKIKSNKGRAVFKYENEYVEVQIPYLDTDVYSNKELLYRLREINPVEKRVENEFPQIRQKTR